MEGEQHKSSAQKTVKFRGGAKGLVQKQSSCKESSARVIPDPVACPTRKPAAPKRKGAKPSPQAQTEPDNAEIQRKAELERRIRKRVALEEKAFRIIERLIEQDFDENFFIDAGNFIDTNHYADIVEERSISKLCGYPICSQPLKNVSQKKYHISLKTNRIYDITESKKFCSGHCYKASQFYAKQLSTTPVWLRDNEPRRPIRLMKEKPAGPAVGEEITFDPSEDVRRELEFLDYVDNLGASRKTSSQNADVAAGSRQDGARDAARPGSRVQPSSGGDSALPNEDREENEHRCPVKENNFVSQQNVVALRIAKEMLKRAEPPSMNAGTNDPQSHKRQGHPRHDLSHQCDSSFNPLSIEIPATDGQGDLVLPDSAHTSSDAMTNLQAQERMLASAMEQSSNRSSVLSEIKSLGNESRATSILESAQRRLENLKLAATPKEPVCHNVSECDAALTSAQFESSSARMHDPEVGIHGDETLSTAAKASDSKARALMELLDKKEALDKGRLGGTQNNLSEQHVLVAEMSGSIGSEPVGSPSKDTDGKDKYFAGFIEELDTARYSSTSSARSHGSEVAGGAGMSGEHRDVVCLKGHGSGTNRKSAVLANVKRVHQQKLASTKPRVDSGPSTARSISSRSSGSDISPLPGSTAAQPKKEKRKKNKKSAPLSSTLEHIQGILMNWRTRETVSYVLGTAQDAGTTEDSDEFRRQYAALCRKVDAQEKEFSALIGDETDLQDDGAVQGKLPDMETLRRDAKVFEGKVQDFYGRVPDPAGGDTTAGGTSAQGETSADHMNIRERGDVTTDKDIILPIVDSQDQVAHRRKIVLERLNRAFPELLSPLKISIRDVSSSLRQLVRTFRLTSTNIVLRPVEWTLVAFFLLKILSVKSRALAASLTDDLSVHYFRSMLLSMRINESEAQGLVDAVLDQRTVT